MSVDFGLILEKQISDLLDLIGFRLISNRLQVDNLLHSILVEEGMAAFAGFGGEARAFEEVANVGEGDVRIGSSRENVGECFAGFAHGGFRFRIMRRRSRGRGWS